MLVALWYTVNIALVIANKWLISTTGFKSTNLLTLFHMITSTLASGALVAGGVVPWKPLTLPLMGKVAVLSGSFTLSVATCMASLAYLPASFVQALGSTTPAFTAILAFLFQGRREARVTYAACLPVVAGIALASGGEPLFNGLGLALQLVACASRSFKTVLQAVLLTDDRERFHPMTLLAVTSALSALSLVPLVAVTEPGGIKQVLELHLLHPRTFGPLLALSCGCAYLANWTNFIISKRLGALTLQVLGNFKNVVAAAMALAVFGNPVTAMGLLGYAITTAGVFTYSHLVAKFPAHRVPAPLGWLIGLGPAPPRQVGIMPDTDTAAAMGSRKSLSAALVDEERAPLLRA
ncbi:hypothetical protein HYH03_001444 [Edaphochlamys debaryana]|uniref:Sugar phosphate transporter domain-containing protein n=1 Tax=Edaphochlamys debaryana TaxID=47281 RepID=A0A835YGA9_9CHLO|nr:hypothetical protein HYH03_001444 [Edaphochlamys debaryana]|eukprot:KAG2500678.1 hypothetical protein HYH03_001444 [Edaphochlamys debaryana]